MAHNECRVYQAGDAPKPRGFAALGIFSLLRGHNGEPGSNYLTLARGTPLDRIWSLNPTAYRQLAPFGRSVGGLFLVLGQSVHLLVEAPALFSDRAQFAGSLSRASPFPKARDELCNRR